MLSAIQKLQLETLALQAELATHEAGFETEAGMCLRFVRQVAQSAFGEAAWPVPRGSDAKDALEWFTARGALLGKSNLGTPGCLLFWVGPGHGKHGHVAIRIPGNRFAENSSLHIGRGDADARGVRQMIKRNRPTHVVRFLPKV
jgi:hypothetical protein